MAEVIENQMLTNAVGVYSQILEATANNTFYKGTLENIESGINNLSISDEKKAEHLINLNINMASSTISKAMDQSLLLVERSVKLDLETALLQVQINSESKTLELKTAQIVSMSREDAIKEAQNTKDLIIKEKQALEIDKTIELKTAQIVSMSREDAIKEKQALLIAAQTLTEASQKLDVEKSTAVKAAQISSIEKDNNIKEKQVLKLDEEIDLITEQANELKQSILDRTEKRPIEVANLTKQGNLIDGQAAKLNEDKLYVTAQKTSMLEQVQHNKIIKGMDSMADMIGTLGAGGLIPSSEMFKVYFTMNKTLTNTDLPTSYSVTKA